MMAKTEIQAKNDRLWETKREAFAASASEHQMGGHSLGCLDLITDLEMEAVWESLPGAREWDMLDIGAGGGRWSLAFAGKVRSVTALEPSPLYDIMAERLARYSNVRTFKTTFEDFEDERLYNFVLIYCTLHFLVDDGHVRAFLEKAASFIADDGFLVLGEPVSKRPKYMFDWRCMPARDDIDVENHLRECLSWEIIRQDDFYASICRKQGLILKKSFLSHAPFFYHLPFKNEPFHKAWKCVHAGFVNRKNIAYLRAYNKAFRGISGRLLRFLDKRFIKIFVFQKADARNPIRAGREVHVCR